ncbi:MAG: hypothetical protein NTW30_00735 [Candidatus Aenigmarchaeota archaeon]|nr:hypothetical protein [Candidatus Aenigmarchaeota archaeon]
MALTQTYVLEGREVTLKFDPKKTDSPTYELIGRLFGNLDTLLPIKGPDVLVSKWVKIEVEDNCVSFFENHYNGQVGWVNVLNIYQTEKKVEVVIPHVDLTYGLSAARAAYKQNLEKIFPNFKIEDFKK